MRGLGVHVTKEDLMSSFAPETRQAFHELLDRLQEIRCSQRNVTER